MKPTVCLLTAGLGTRLGEFGRYLNKALLPLDKQAIISQIIRRFPPETEFVIGLGHLADQVQTYLEMAHPTTDFKFVRIENYAGPGSGPGLSLLTCKGHLQKPFHFVSCDTLWDDEFDWSLKESWLGVCRVPPAESARYCNLQVKDGAVVDLRDKQEVHDADYWAFVGLMGIKDYERFWEGLERRDTVAGEHQVSNGLRALIENTHVEAWPITWTDVGELEGYRKAVNRFEAFDFSKVNEALYIVNGTVIKFFADPVVAEKRVRKSRMVTGVFPEIGDHRGQFYSYNLVPGRTMYEVGTPERLQHLLEWLSESLWKPAEASAEEMASICYDFYRTKTLERIRQYQEKHAIEDRATTINGTHVPATSELLGRVPWERLYAGKPVFMHGDLQFDNILYDHAGDSFVLLDWRHEFGGKVEFGDLYYDLAKLYGGLLLNYDYIKKNLLSYEERAGVIWYDFAQRSQAGKYVRVLEDFMRSHDLDLAKVRLLVPIIYLNMSPLHHSPFDVMLYSLGRDLLHQALNAGETES